jgi:hypothetical protein
MISLFRRKNASIYQILSKEIEDKEVLRRLESKLARLLKDEKNSVKEVVAYIPNPKGKILIDQTIGYVERREFKNYRAYLDYLGEVGL